MFICVHTLGEDAGCLPLFIEAVSINGSQSLLILLVTLPRDLSVSSMGNPKQITMPT